MVSRNSCPKVTQSVSIASTSIQVSVTADRILMPLAPPLSHLQNRNKPVSYLPGILSGFDKRLLRKRYSGVITKCVRYALGYALIDLLRLSPFITGPLGVRICGLCPKQVSVVIMVLYLLKGMS